MMTEGLNPLELVLNASIVVQIVMALLLLASIVSWSIMLRKRSELSRARADADRFEEMSRPLIRLDRLENHGLRSISSRTKSPR